MGDNSALQSRMGERFTKQDRSYTTTSVRGAALSAVWLTFTPFFAELWVGQFTFILGSLLFWSVLAVEDGRESEGMAWWIGSVLWKPASLLWLPIWLRKRRHWPGVAACFGLLGLNLAYFHFHPADWRVFATTNLDPTPQWHAGNMGLSALIYNFTGPGHFFRIIRTLATAAVLAPALVVTLRKPERPLWLLASIWTCAYFLVYKDVWEHHLTLLLPFLVLSLWRAPSRWTLAWSVLLALPSPFIFYDPRWVGWYKADIQPVLSPSISLLHHAWRVVPVAALFIGWLRTAWIGSPHPTGRPLPPTLSPGRGRGAPLSPLPFRVPRKRVTGALAISHLPTSHPMGEGEARLQLHRFSRPEYRSVRPAPEGAGV